jgi:c-di-GMP-binding flagellar brake protein YcgR
MAGSGSDRRQFQRFAPPVEVQLEVPGKLLGPLNQQQLRVRIMDLSTGGVGLFVDREIEKGRQVNIRIIYPELKEGLELVGTVKRSVAPPPVAKDWIIGIEFNGLTLEAHAVLDRWQRHAASTMVRSRHEDKRRDFGLTGPGPDGIR